MSGHWNGVLKTHLLDVGGRGDQLQALHLPEVRRVAEHVHEHELRDATGAQRGVLVAGGGGPSQQEGPPTRVSFSPQEDARLVAELGTHLRRLLGNESTLLSGRLAVADGLREREWPGVSRKEGRGRFWPVREV